VSGPSGYRAQAECRVAPGASRLPGCGVIDAKMRLSRMKR
jgi:hypothetical protein